MNDLIRYADNKLYEWSCFIRHGNRIDIGFTISSCYGTKIPGIVHDNDIYTFIDRVVGRMQDPMKRVVIRHYLDPVPGKRHVYYSQSGRIISNKAKTEKLSVETYKDYLRMGRVAVYSELERRKLAA